MEEEQLQVEQEAAESEQLVTQPENIAAPVIEQVATPVPPTPTPEQQDDDEDGQEPPPPEPPRDEEGIRFKFYQFYIFLHILYIFQYSFCSLSKPLIFTSFTH